MKKEFINYATLLTAESKSKGIMIDAIRKVVESGNNKTTSLPDVDSFESVVNLSSCVHAYLTENKNTCYESILGVGIDERGDLLAYIVYGYDVEDSVDGEEWCYLRDLSLSHMGAIVDSMQNESR